MSASSSITTFVPAATLDGFARQVAAGDGVSLDAFEPLTTLLVETRNSVYRLILCQHDQVVVQGGRFFPEPTRARFTGSGLGGSLLKAGWIGVGLRMEVYAGRQRVVTSPVRRISREAEPAEVQ